MEAVLPLEIVGVVEVRVLVPQIRPDEPSNIPSLSAVEVYHAPQSVCAKDDAPENISSMLVTLDTSHLERSLLNDDAEANMPIMLVVLDTSHLERSPLNLSAPGTRSLLASKNNWCISVTAETSQDPIGPCGPLEQSKSDAFRHSTMAAWSSTFDFGAQALVVVRVRGWLVMY